MIQKLIWSARFAIAEIRNEWVFGIGVALAVSSVVTPAALLWGTKSGMIDTMRERLLREPTIRELVGQENNALPTTWFNEKRTDPRVAFVIPSVRRISLYGDVSKSGSDAEVVSDVAYLPTAVGDPVGGGVDLPSEYEGGAVPCMISTKVADSLQALKGETITITVARIENETIVQVTLEARVDRVLDPSDSGAMAVYLPLPVIERIEDYKDGSAVPLFGWTSGVRSSLRTYDSFRIRFESAGNPVVEKAAIDRSSLRGKLTLRAAAEPGQYEAVVNRDGVAHDELLGFVRGLANLDPRILLLAEAPFKVGSSDGGAEREGWLQGDPKDWLRLADLEAIEMGSITGPNDAPLLDFKVAAPSGLSKLRLYPPTDTKEGTRLIVAPKVLGVIGAAKRRNIEYNIGSGELRGVRSAYPGFRLYAKELEDVRPLRLECEKAGISVRTNEDRIESVVYLDAALGKFLAFVVVAGALGGLGALFTSLYLSIERSRRQFAVLQILGIPATYVFLSSFLQAVTMVLAGIVASFAFFQIGSALLATVLASGSGPNDRLCELEPRQWAVLTATSLGSALLATILARGRLRFKDPAVVARSE
jgi:putative ABC transport system permease protein